MEVCRRGAKLIRNAAKTLFSIVMVALSDLFAHQKPKKLVENPAIGLTDGMDCIIIVYKVHTMYTWCIGASGVAMAHVGHR